MVYLESVDSYLADCSFFAPFFSGYDLPAIWCLRTLCIYHLPGVAELSGWYIRDQQIRLVRIASLYLFSHRLWLGFRSVCSVYSSNLPCTTMSRCVHLTTSQTLHLSEGTVENKPRHTHPPVTWHHHYDPTFCKSFTWPHSHPRIEQSNIVTCLTYPNKHLLKSTLSLRYSWLLTRKAHAFSHVCSTCVCLTLTWRFQVQKKTCFQVFHFFQLTFFSLSRLVKM